MRTNRLFGIDFVSEDSVRPVVDWLLARTHDDRAWPVVVTPNVDHLVRYDKHDEERSVAASAAFALPDGMPLVVASRVLGARLRARLTGVDLFAALWPRLVDGAVPVVVVVSDHEVAARLRASHPLAHAIVPPMFAVDDDDTVAAVTTDIVDAVTDVRARFVVLGVSMPKHHRLARELAQRQLPAGQTHPAVLLLGAAAEFYVGRRQRAPRWMQRAGLEWLHRLLIDPRRMARRYLIEDPAFVRIVCAEWRSMRAARRR